ncbi:U3 snoRNP protein [Serendipita sp. 405]|nr:U3 snoRNP protein [Serendipita sp. 405]
MSSEDVAQQQKRFKHRSYQNQIKDVHLPSPFASTATDQNIEEDQSHFYASLDHWKQLNLSPPFLQYVKASEPLSATLTLLLHHWEEVVDLWVDAMKDADLESKQPLLALMQKLIHDLRTTLLPKCDLILDTLLAQATRSLPPATLETYSQTLSTFLRQLLLPTPRLLKTFWTKLNNTIRKCRPDIRRILAEVWGAILRRLKTDQKREATELLVASLDTIQDAIALVYVNAFQSTSSTLHTSTVPLLELLIGQAIGVGEDRYEAIMKLLRRVLTATMHYCTIETFTAISDIIVARMQALPDPTTETEACCRTMEIALVVCAFRKGKRAESMLSSDQLSTILTKLSAIPSIDGLKRSMSSLVVACLKGSEMSVWVRARSTLEHIWKDPETAYWIAEALLKLDQSKGANWKVFVQPLVQKYSMMYCGQYPSVTLRLFRALAVDGRVRFEDAEWKTTIGSLCQRTLQDWELDSPSVLHLYDILPLVSLLPDLAPSISNLVENLLQLDIDFHANYKETPANVAWCLGACLQALGTADKWEDYGKVDQWLKRCLDGFYWNPHVLRGLVSLAPHSADPMAFIDAFSSLKDSVMSHISSLRLYALKLLASDLVKRDAAQQAAIEVCLTAEEVELSATQTPERVLKTTKVGSMAPVGQSAGSTEVCVQWAVAQFKVNLMPVWKAAAQAVVALVERSGEDVWPIVIEELRSLFDSSTQPVAPGWSVDIETEQFIQEDEKTWRNAGLRETLMAINAASAESALSSLTQAQVTHERLDLENYEKQILKALEGCSNLAERHNRDLIPLFLSFASPNTSSRSSQHKLSPWLSLLSKFNNPKAVLASDALHSLYITLLSYPDRHLQKLAVDCILTYKSKALLAHQTTIRGLMEDGQWKEYITGLDLSSGVQPADRSEYVEFLVRMFYGMMRERRGRNKLHERRNTLINTLRQCTSAELGVLVGLMLEPFEVTENGMDVDAIQVRQLPNSLTGKQQVGFLVLLGEVMRLLGTKLVPYFMALLSTVVDIVANAQRVLENAISPVDNAEVDEIGEDEEDEGKEEAVAEEDGGQLPLKVARNLRQLGIKRFTDPFRLPIDYDFTPLLPVAFDAFINPRLEMLDVENTQSPSAIMELFYCWSAQPSYVPFLADYNPAVLPKIYACLVATNVKPAVVARIFGIIEKVFMAASSDQKVAEALVKPHIFILIEYLAKMIKDSSTSGTTAPESYQNQIYILRTISEYAADAPQAIGLIQLLLPMLQKPSSQVGEKTKVELLQVICRLVTLIGPEDSESARIVSAVFESVSYLLQSLRGRQARIAVSNVFTALVSHDTSMSRLAPLIEALNSFDRHRPEEPDFDRRMEAFTTLNEELYSQLSTRQWTPVLHNMIHFIHDRDELSIRNNAAFSLKRFIEMVGKVESLEMQRLFNQVVLTGLKNGLRSKHETVRGELVSVLAFAVKICPNNPSLADMTPLLASGDEEANFFNNIGHIQVHRRTRALRRLAEHCSNGQMRPSTLYEIFVPMISHFIADKNTDHHLVNEAITTIGQISRHLGWSRYYALVQKFLKAVKEEGSAEKVNMRTVVAILDNFHFTMEEVVQVTIEEEDSKPDVVAIEHAQSTKVTEVVNNRLLPSLLQFMEQRQETEDALRLPMAVGVVKVALHLPEDKRRPQITRLLTILSQALRSKSSETRDIARDVICKIVTSIGPSYLSTAVKELKMALTRGPQLHVLAVTCHSLIHHITSDENAQKEFVNLDEVAASVAEVSAEVIFGQSGKELQGEDFKTKMREVRSASSKGLDAMTILARFITPTAIGHILLPLRSIMHETQATKVMQLVDETLKRIASGLNSNALLDPPALLSLCHTLVSQNAKFLQEKQKIGGRKQGKKDFIVQTKRDLPQAARHYAQNSYRFIVFGLDLFVVAFRRNRFDFQDEGIIARLEPLVSTIGNTLYSTATPVVIAGLKAAASIIRAPLHSVPRSLSVIIHQQVEIVRQAGSVESEVAQTALKSLATTLRECASSQLKENDLKFILEVMEPDLEEVERQASVFALLRAIIKRKLVVPEIYDMLDKIASIMVTSQSSQVQEVCRGILLQFLLDYPQGKGRLKKQMTFLASNLTYTFDSGRISVMTFLDAIFHKFEPSLLAEFLDLFFVSLVMVLANDESAQCREQASRLIKSLYEVMGAKAREQMFERTRVWASQASQQTLVGVAFQIYGFMIDVAPDDSRQHLEVMLEGLNRSLKEAVDEQEQATFAEPDSMDIDPHWQTPYQAILVLSKILKLLTDAESAANILGLVDWKTVVDLMLFPHAWIRMASSRFLGALYATQTNSGFKSHISNIDPFSPHGMIRTARNSSMQLRSAHIDQAFSIQIVKNLVFLGKSFYASRNRTQVGADSDSEDGRGTESESSAGEPDKNVKLEQIVQAPLPWLFSRLSYQVKASHLKRRNRFDSPKNWYLEPLAILQWFAAMVSIMDADDLQQFLNHILTPVYRLLEDDTVRDNGMDEAKTMAQELQELVQSKVGTTAFTAAYTQIRQGALAIRRERKAAQAVLNTADPQAAAKRQMRRNMAKKDGRKRKSQFVRELKTANVPSKRRRVE